MSDPSPPRERPTAAWLAEQERKQAAYAARRRTWARGLERAADPDAAEAPEPPSVPTARPAEAGASRRARGKVHDRRQERFEF